MYTVHRGGLSPIELSSYELDMLRDALDLAILNAAQYDENTIELEELLEKLEGK